MFGICSGKGEKNPDCLDMKLLFVRNLSYRIVKKIKELYLNADHIKSFGLTNALDIEIWNFAKKNDFIIVTQDADFYEMSLLFSFPPKIIWIKTGNTSTNYIIDLFKKHRNILMEFYTSEEIGCLELE